MEKFFKLYLEEGIHDRDGKVKGLLKHLEAAMDVDKPIHQNGSHGGTDQVAIHVLSLDGICFLG